MTKDKIQLFLYRACPDWRWYHLVLMALPLLGVLVITTDPEEVVVSRVSCVAVWSIAIAWGSYKKGRDHDRLDDEP